MSLDKCKLINLKINHDVRGNLTPIESNKDIPFEIKRAYYLYDVPGGSSRAGHAHKTLHQFLIAMSGSFDIHVMDKTGKKSFHMNRAYYGLYIPPMIWREIDNFSSGAVCLALASNHYDPKDYYHSWDEYIKMAGGK